MHNAIKVISKAKVSDDVVRIFIEIRFFGFFDILQMQIDILISIRRALLVKKSTNTNTDVIEIKL